MLYLLHKKELHRHLSLSQNLKPLQTLRIVKNNLHVNYNGIEWKDNNREVVISGKYFEVVDVRFENDLATLYLVEDKNESNLFKWFFFELDDEDEKGNERLNQHIDYYFTEFRTGETLKKQFSFISFLVCKQPNLTTGHLSLNFIPPKHSV